jgi:hypothetical protein
VTKVKQNLSLATLGQLDDGTVGAVVDAAIADILKDCDDRPGLKKARRVTLEVSFEPVVDERSFVLKGVDVSAQVKLSVPAQTMREQYLQTSLDTAVNRLEAHLPDAHQDSMFTETKERN